MLSITGAVDFEGLPALAQILFGAFKGDTQLLPLVNLGKEEADQLPLSATLGVSQSRPTVRIQVPLGSESRLYLAPDAEVVDRWRFTVVFVADEPEDANHMREAFSGRAEMFLNLDIHEPGTDPNPT